MTATEVAQSFVEAINLGDAERLWLLMAEDHVFIDSLGGEYHGRDTMRSGWRSYFSVVPDYRIEVLEIYDNGSVVIMVGTAQGTYAPEGKLDLGARWSAPAAWKAVISEERVAVWQVFADNEPLRRMMRRYGNG